MPFLTYTGRYHMELLPQFKTNDDGSRVLKQARCDVCDTKRECYVDEVKDWTVNPYHSLNRSMHRLKPWVGYERYMCPSCVSGKAREAVAQEWESEGNTHMAYMTRNY